jgi:hypothetical protein
VGLRIGRIYGPTAACKRSFAVKNGATGRKKSARPALESLETRALLSGLTSTLTTSQSVYLPGQPIQFVLTMTNNSSQAVQFGDGPSIDGFDISEGGTLVYQSNGGVNPLFIRLDTLQPGQSFTLSGTWNGVSNQQSSPPVTAGTFTVTNQLDPNGPSATFQIETPPSNAPPPITWVSPPAAPSPLSATVTANRTALRIGHSASFTLTLTNSGSQPIEIPGPSIAPSFTLEQRSNMIWRSIGTSLHSQAVEALAPGESIEFHGRWLGKPNQSGAHAIKPGLYQLIASLGEFSATATVRLTH